jgi:hypothetical protein
MFSSRKLNNANISRRKNTRKNRITFISFFYREDYKGIGGYWIDEV